MVAKHSLPQIGVTHDRRCALHARKVDHQAVVANSEARAIVAAAANRGQHLIAHAKPNRRHHVRYIHADFPHDSYWQSAVIEFSDGGQLPIQIIQSAEFQDFTFPKRSVSWIRLNKLVPADPARWCSFIEVEAWGSDLK